MAGLLVPLTNLWWIVVLLGAAAPVVVAVSGAQSGAGQENPDAKARELLTALAERGELTAAEAALVTSCTAAEASALLEGSRGRALPRAGRVTTSRPTRISWQSRPPLRGLPQWPRRPAPSPRLLSSRSH